MTILSKSDGTETVTVSANTTYYVDLPTYGKHYTIAWVIPAGITVGTFTFTARAVGSDTYEAVKDSTDTQITMDVTSPETLHITNTVCDSLGITVSSLTGSGDVLVTPTCTN